MAGKYYSATPIGAGMQNLATAISGIPEREAKAGLMAARMDETRNQILLHSAQREKVDEETSGIRRKNTAREAWANRVRQGATTGDGGPPADEVAPTPNTDTSIPSVANAFTSSATPVGPSTVDPGPLPIKTAPSVAPSVASAVVPRSGITPQFNRDFHADAILAEEDNVGQYLRSLVGGNMAATEPNQDKAFSYTQGGAGQGYEQTFTGGQGKQQQTATRDTQASSDRRYNTDQRTQTTIRGQNMTDERVRSGAGRAGGGGSKAKGKDPHPPLTTANMTWVNKQIDDYAKANGKSLTAQTKMAMRQQVEDHYADGASLQDSLDLTHSNAYKITPEHEEPGRFFGTNKVPAKTEVAIPTPRPRGGAAAAPGGAAPAAAPKTDPKRVEGLRAMGKKNGWSDTQINDALKARGML